MRVFKQSDDSDRRYNDPPSGFLLALIALYVGSWANLFWPIVRFDFEIANYIAFAAAQLIPAAILFSSTFSNGWARWIWVSVGLVFSIPACPVGFGAAACVVLLPTQSVSLFERLSVHSVNKETVAVYRSNGSALDADGITVRQECRIAPGLLVVRPLAHAYPANGARIELQQSGTVRITMIENHGEQPPTLTPRPVQLRRLCWGPSI